MEVKAALAPGQNGTRQMFKQYGDLHLCVRCRYDKARQKRIRTIELTPKLHKKDGKTLTKPHEH